MKHKQPGNSWWSHALALFMAILMTVQLTVPVFAEMKNEPVEQVTIAEETQEPEAETTAPQEETQEPETETTVPQEETQEPETETTVPQEETQEPEAETIVPQEETQEPETETTAPQESTVPLSQTEAAGPIVIPGYTQVTNAELETNKIYLIVSRDSDGNLYAFYPDKAHANAPAGNAIGTKEDKGCFVAAITMQGEKITAVHESDNQALNVNDLHFTVKKNGGKYTFQGSNGLYLALESGKGGNRMLTEKPMNFTVTAKPDGSYKLVSDGTRILDFNKHGDPKSAEMQNLNTNFWGPSRNDKFPIYLFTQNGTVAPEEPAAPVIGRDIRKMFDRTGAENTDNTWMFDGGAVTQGSFDDIGEARSYIYQFEEYIRWTNAGRQWVARQRFVFNVAKKGQTLADSLKAFDNRAADLAPKAAVYFVGPEDCAAGTAGVETFKKDLANYINKALALRAGTGFAVIMTPYQGIENAESYAAAVREVVTALKTEEQARVQIVDLSKTALSTNSRGYLTAKGHLEAGRLLSQAVYGSTVHYPATTVPASFPQLTEQYASYHETPAVVTAGADKLTVELPGDVSSVKYTLELTGSYTLTGEGTGTFTLEKLPAGASYTLTMTDTASGAKLPQMTGAVSDGVKGTVVADKTGVLTDIANSSEPLTWMFMGDSITHGALHTCGYDSISQSFEKYLKDDLGRHDDVVINTAVSSAATADTLSYINERLNKYKPDVVFVMLGTNCTREANYEGNLIKIVDAIQAKGATVVLRTPVCQKSISNPYVPQTKIIKKVAEARNLTVVDQNTVWHDVLSARPYLAGLVYNDNIHPNAIGHQWMLKMLLEETGLAKASSRIYNHGYDLHTAQKTGTQTPYVAFKDGTAVLNTALLNGSYAEVTLTAVDAAANQRYSVTVPGGQTATLTDLPADKNFTFEIQAHEKNANTVVNFKGSLDEQADPLTIPGYTRVTTADLDSGKYYLIVSKDSNGKLYAFYPDKDHADTPAGNAIGIEKDKGCFVANLTIADGTVSAVHESDQKALTMESLHFTATPSGNKYTFRDNNGLYLAMESGMSGKMLTDKSMNFTVTMKQDGSFILFGDSTRVLDFNLKGDANEFTANGKTFMTNFWGPSLPAPRYPIYLYTKDDVVIVNKEGLKAAIAQAQALDLTKLSDESVAEIQAALSEATKVRDDKTATAEAVKAAEEKLNNAVLTKVPKAELIADGAPAPGTTQDQPFKAGSGGVGNYRIPAIITLTDGTLVAAADSRWNNYFDGFNIDTMLSISKDNGKTWNYSFPNFFNDSVNQHNKQSTSFIDSVLAEGKDGTLYLMTDVMPGGNWTKTLKALTGYETVDDVRRMVLYTSVNNHTHDNYAFYVGDFQNGYAPVITKGDNTKTPVYYVDEYFYLYNVEKKPLYCQQLGSDKYVKQNVFFTNAILHVAAADYLWLVTSKDGGTTWSAPTILNPQVRDEYSNYVFYGTGPGAGICMDDGTVLLPCYDHAPERANFVYTRDQGKTWKRSPNATPAGESTNNVSSESALVKIDGKTVRQFYRDSVNDLRYTDFTWNSDTQTWTVGEPVKQPGVVKAHQTQLSAIRYSKEINGKPVILVSTATGTSNPRRTNGKVYAFNLESDNTMTHIGTYEVTKRGVMYAYSSLTELKDGSIGLLYESHERYPAAITYVNIAMKDILQIEDVEAQFSCGETKSFPAKATDVVINSNPEVVDAQIVKEEKKVPVVNGAQGHKGTDVQFGGELAPLSSALFRFVGTNETGIQITTQTADGTQVWLSTATIGYPTTKTETVATLTQNPNGTFYIHTDASYLYFWRDNKNGKLATFDRVGNPAKTPACEFKLYRPAAKDEQSDLPGYVQVTKLADIQDGGFYLIAASVGKDLYVLYPTIDNENKYAQSLKVDPNAEKVTDSVSYYEAKLSITAKTAGTADVQAGKNVYHITVAHSAGEEWKHDASGHWHECNCGEKQDLAEHSFGDWTEVKAPTETEAGLKVHRCTVCGFEETAEIPVVPVNPSEPTEPSKPTEPSEPTEPSVPTEPSKPTEPSVPAEPSVPTEPSKPTEPSEPTEPSKPVPATPGQGNRPQTGDNSQALLWSVLVVISGLSIAVIAVYGKKKYHN